MSGRIIVRITTVGSCRYYSDDLKADREKAVARAARLITTRAAKGASIESETIAVTVEKDKPYKSSRKR